MKKITTVVIGRKGRKYIVTYPESDEALKQFYKETISNNIRKMCEDMNFKQGR